MSKNISLPQFVKSKTKKCFGGEFLFGEKFVSYLENSSSSVKLTNEKSFKFQLFFISYVTRGTEVTQGCFFVL